LKKKDRRGWRSPRLYPEERRAPPRRALQNPVYIRKKAAAHNKREEKRKNLSRKTKIMIKYIAYCRKSTDEKEKQVLSIESQIAELKEFAAKEKLQIVCFLTESRTAKSLGRPVFEEVVQKIERGEANAILSWHPDRLARNSVDGGKIVYLLDTGKLLDLKFPTFWFDNTPQGKFMLSIAFGQSKYYVDNLSENVKRGNRQKLREELLEQQLRAIVAKSSLPNSWAKLWLERLDKEGTEEKANSENQVTKFSSEVQEIDKKLDRLLEGYLDQIVDPQVYQQKKNELVELKIKLKEKMASISKNGSEWLGLMRKFIEVAASAAKIARAKHNGEELSFFAKKVGSDYSLDNRRLFCVYKQGFATLAAGAPYVPQGKGAASAIPDDPFSSKLWTQEVSNL